MFCGKTQDEHGHHSYAVDENTVKRDDIKVDFNWDILDRGGNAIISMSVVLSEGKNLTSARVCYE